MFDLVWYILSFVFVITTLVFVHEFGHYYVAKLCGVKVLKFSIGMGKAFFTREDNSGTQWCFSWLPIGGYVKMLGDGSAASNPDFDILQQMDEQTKKHSFHHKNVWQRLAIVAAGPLSNYLFAVILFTGLFYFSGAMTVAPIVSSIAPGSPADKGGMKIGDTILSLDNNEISEFADIQKFLVLHNTQENILIKLKRDNNEIAINITPKFREITDDFGDKHQIPFVGISSSQFTHKKYDLVTSFSQSIYQCYDLSKTTLIALSQIVTGKRSYKELSGPVSIAKYSGKTAKLGFKSIIWFLALLSVNLGLINLLPVPMLDGGHIIFYLIEIITGKPVKKSIQEYGFRVGFILLITMMIVATTNDLIGIIWKK
jgi:regulator of sigma E protease